MDLELKQANFMWKLDNDLIPKSLARNFRTSRNRIVPIFNRLESSAKHITYAGPKIWQNLPDELKKIAFPKTFSKAMQNHLLPNNHAINTTNSNTHRSLANRSRNQGFQSRWDLEIGQPTNLI